MRAALRHTTSLKHDDFIRIDNGGEAMGDHNGCAAFGHSRQRLLNIGLCPAVERRGRFVEDEDGRGKDFSAMLPRFKKRHRGK